MLFHMYQVFSSLQGHLHFFEHFSFTFIEHFFIDHPIFCMFFFIGYSLTACFLSPLWHSVSLPVCQYVCLDVKCLRKRWSSRMRLVTKKRRKYPNVIWIIYARVATFLNVCLPVCLSVCLSVQLNLGVTDVKGPTNFIHYWRIFFIANIGDKEKWFKGTII